MANEKNATTFIEARYNQSVLAANKSENPFTREEPTAPAKSDAARIMELEWRVVLLEAENHRLKHADELHRRYAKLLEKANLQMAQIKKEFEDTSSEMTRENLMLAQMVDQWELCYDGLYDSNERLEQKLARAELALQQIQLKHRRCRGS